MKTDEIELLEHALIGYRIQIESLDGRIADLRKRLGQNGAAPPKSKPATKPAKKHRLSAAGRRRIAAATKERWRRARAAGRTRLG